MKVSLNFLIVFVAFFITIGLLNSRQVIVKKIFPIVKVEPQQEYVVIEKEPGVKIVYVEKCSPKLTYFSIIHPSDIPETKRWLYRGEDLKMHIFMTHGIQYERMRILSHYDLIKLHSYLHNGGSL